MFICMWEYTCVYSVFAVVVCFISPPKGNHIFLSKTVLFIFIPPLVNYIPSGTEIYLYDEEKQEIS